MNDLKFENAQGTIMVSRSLSSNTKALVVANALLVNALGGSFTKSHPMRVDVRDNDVFLIVTPAVETTDLNTAIKTLREYPD